MFLAVATAVTPTMKKKIIFVFVSGNFTPCRKACAEAAHYC